MSKSVGFSAVSSAEVTITAVAPETVAPNDSPRRGQVLVVDDNAVLGKVLGRYVEDLGFEAVFAVNGEEAVTKFRGRKLSLVLMDVEMPVMNGIEATKQIREVESSSEDEDLKRVPIVGCTSISEECAEQCLEAGMDACLHKPATRAQVKGVFEKYVAASLTKGE